MEKPNYSAGFVCHANPVSGLNHGGGFVEQGGGGAIYMECRRNYAASTGGYTVDGCGKFVVKAAGGGNSSSTQGDALLCVTCGCHRSFHRKILLPPRHLWDTYRNYIMNYLRSLPLSVLQSRLPWLLRSPTPTVPNCEPIEGQGSSMGPEEGDQQPGSDSGDEINQLNKKRIRQELKN